MATFPITYPDAQGTRILNALTARWGWSENSGLTKAEFLHQHIQQWLRSEVLEQEGREARDTAHQASPPDIEVG
jgi:hypothetical protein